MIDLKKLEAIQLVYARLNQCMSVSPGESKRLSDYLWLAMTGTGGPTKSEDIPDQPSGNTLLPVAPDNIFYYPAPVKVKQACQEYLKAYNDFYSNKIESLDDDLEDLFSDKTLALARCFHHPYKFDLSKDTEQGEGKGVGK